MAMQETLACVINMHGESVDEESSYQFFGRRNLNGIPMRTPGSCANLPWIEIQFQDMETHASNMEKMLRTEMYNLDWSKKILQQNNEKYHQLKKLVGWLGNKRDQLYADNT
jgi:hypothetical protein